MAGGSSKKPLDFGIFWHITPDLELALGALVENDANAVSKMCALGATQQRLQRHQDFARHGAGHDLAAVAILAEQIMIAIGLDPLRRQLGQLETPKIWQNMQVEMLAVLRDGRALAAIGLQALDPPIGDISHGGLAVDHDMGALAELDLDLGGTAIGFTLADEGFKPALTGMIGVIDDPGFPRLTVAGGPNAFTDGHESPPSCLPNR